MSAQDSASKATEASLQSSEFDSVVPCESVQGRCQGGAQAVAAGAVGIGGPCTGSATSRPGTRGSYLGQLSIRSDWSDTTCSQEDMGRVESNLSEVCEASALDGHHIKLRTLSETYSRNLRSGRHTFTRTMSPRMQVRYGVHSIQNKRREMEDAHRAVLGAGGSCGSTSTLQSESAPESIDQLLGSLSYFAVFDGHGGSRAAEFSGEALVSLLVADRRLLAADPAEALRRAFAQTEEQWLAFARQNDFMDGTTAAVVLVDRECAQCVVGNVGDSEVLLGIRDSDGRTRHQALTQVHHLKRSEPEAKRVTDAGGRIWHGRLAHPKINPQVLSLSVSRAIGDLFFKDEGYTGGQASGLTAEPYITSAEVCGSGLQEQFLLIGCDGLWDTVTYSEAADFVFAQLRAGECPQAISERLVGRARDAGSMDNITVMVVVL